MTATATESRHFTWHCAVAALLMELPKNPAISAHVRHAVRMATETAAGKKGVLYASKRARAIKEASGESWGKCGLVKEHVIPVSEVYKRVIQEFALLRAKQTANDTTGTASTDLRTILAKGELSLVREDRRVQQLEQMIRKWTLLAWISKDEHELLEKNGLQKCMPTGWDGRDKFARYEDCKIEFIEIRPISQSVL
jgi:hypothetical protein